MKRIFVLAYVFGVYSCSFSFIYEISVLRLKNPSNTGHYFIGCGDFHTQNHSFTAIQKQGVISQFSRQINKKIKILVEDLSSKTVMSERVCGPFSGGDNNGILAGLSQQLEQLGLHVKNVEYRYVRVASLSEILNNVTANPYSFRSACAFRVSVLIDEAMKIIREVEQYNDGLILNLIYQQGCACVEQMISSLLLNKQKGKTVASFCHDNSTLFNRIPFLRKLLTFDSSLVDFRLLHEIVNADDEQTVIAFAGGTHIKRVCHILKKIGYEEVESVSVTYPYIFDIRSCCEGGNLASITSSVCPNPIGLELLEKYLE